MHAWMSLCNMRSCLMHQHDNQLPQHVLHDIFIYTMQVKGSPKAQNIIL